MPEWSNKKCVDTIDQREVFQTRVSVRAILFSVFVPSPAQ